MKRHVAESMRERSQVVGMNRKKLALLVILVVLLLAALFAYYDHKLIDNTVQTSEDGQTAGAGSTDGDVATVIDGGTVPTQAGTSPAGIVPEMSDQASGSETLLNNEAVGVGYNSPEYDLKLSLCEDRDKKTFIRIEYYKNGSSAISEIDEGSLPELAGLFEKRAAEPGSEGGYRISQALLNPVYGQLYILINDVPPGEYMQSAFYMIDLSDMSVRKLFYYPGRYGEMKFNKDFTLLAYSFGDPPLLSVYQEDNLVEVYDCKNAEYIVRGNLYVPEHHIIGSNSSDAVLYDFWFEGWNSAKVLKLKMDSRPLSALENEPVTREVLYDVSKNLLLDLNGNKLKPEIPDNSAASSVSFEAGGEDTGHGETGGKAGNDTGSAGNKTNSGSPGNPDPAGSDSAVKPTDSAPLKTLKNFYIYLNSESTYKKAMDLLDDGFMLRLGMLEQFGVTTINKADISSEYNEDNINLYSELLKAANFDTMAKENTEGSQSTISYYQVMKLGENTQRQFLSARLVLTGGKWKITSIEDGVK